MALIAAVLSACSGATDKRADQAPIEPDPVKSVSAQTLPSNGDNDAPSAETETAAENLLRMANAYHLEWDDTAALCAIALESLNQPFAMPSRSRSLPDGTATDYASKQAVRYLGGNKNLQWVWGTDDTTVVGFTQKATFDYFNDGVERVIVRTRGQLAGNRVVGLALEERGKVFPINFGYAGAAVEDLPDQDNLHTKLTYSVADVIRLGGNYYTLLMPLLDFDKSARVYLVTWHPKEGTSSPRASSDYYPQIACVFRSANASSLDEPQD